RRAAALLVAVVAVLGACGVQEDRVPRPLAEDEVPFGLLAPDTSVVEPAPGSGVGVQSTIWFVDNDGLLARSRRTIQEPVDVADVVRALLEPVTEAEAAAGLRSNIPQGTQLLGIDGPTDGLVTLDLSDQFLTVTGSLQRLALAQMVFTVTGLANVDRVLFEFDGQAAEVPGAGDELTSEPLTRADFSQFDPLVTTTTVTP
ncbi:MAG TPA: GerMN domain-containing protein, partial [Acidimicrobiales bacterium]|nr:GerMN domain-containing protein [Acidimicrobiales bacterium]